MISSRITIVTTIATIASPLLLKKYSRVEDNDVIEGIDNINFNNVGKNKSSNYYIYG